MPFIGQKDVQRGQDTAVTRDFRLLPWAWVSVSGVERTDVEPYVQNLRTQNSLPFPVLVIGCRFPHGWQGRYGCLPHSSVRGLSELAEIGQPSPARHHTGGCRPRCLSNEAPARPLEARPGLGSGPQVRRNKDAACWERRGPIRGDLLGGTSRRLLAMVRVLAGGKTQPALSGVAPPRNLQNACRRRSGRRAGPPGGAKEGAERLRRGCGVPAHQEASRTTARLGSRSLGSPHGLRLQHCPSSSRLQSAPSLSCQLTSFPRLSGKEGLA